MNTIRITNRKSVLDKYKIKHIAVDRGYKEDLNLKLQ